MVVIYSLLFIDLEGQVTPEAGRVCREKAEKPEANMDLEKD
jgi:hypothetical protein